MGIEELSIEVTNECTLACLHCSSGSVPKRGANELTFTEHQRLLREAHNMGAKTLSLSGGNPLLYDHLSSLVYRAADLGFENILIYTTGHNRLGDVIATAPNVNVIMDLPQVRWIFSLHSHRTDVNDMIMNVPGATEHIHASMEWLIERRQTVEIHMVPMKPNYRDIPYLRDRLGDMGVKKMSLLRFVPQTRGRLHKDQLGMSRQDFIRMQMIIVDEMERDHVVQLRCGCPIDFRHAVGALDDKAKPCHAGDDLMLVRPNGAVHPCAAWKSLPSDSNVRSDSLADIWVDSHVFTGIRDFKAHGYRAVGGCASCQMLDSCQTGCPAQRLHAYTNGTKPSMDDLYCGASDPLCPRGNDGGHV